MSTSGSETPRSSGVSLDVHEHQVVTLIGASGSGTSTLLRCLNRLRDYPDRPSGGQQQRVAIAQMFTDPRKPQTQLFLRRSSRPDETLAPTAPAGRSVA